MILVQDCCDWHQEFMNKDSLLIALQQDVHDEIDSEKIRIMVDKLDKLEVEKKEGQS